MVNLVEVDEALSALDLSPGVVSGMSEAARLEAYEAALCLAKDTLKATRPKPAGVLGIFSGSPKADDANDDTNIDQNIINKLNAAAKTLTDSNKHWYVVQFGEKYCLLDYASFNHNQLLAIQESLPEFKADADFTQAATKILEECLPNGDLSPKIDVLVNEQVDERLYYLPTIWRQLQRENWIYSYAKEGKSEQQYRALVNENALKHIDWIKLLINPVKAASFLVCSLLTPFIAAATAAVNNIDRMRESERLGVKCLGYALTANAALLGYFVLGVVGTVNSVMRLLNHPYNLTKYYIRDRKTKDKSLEDVLTHGVFMLFSCLVLYNLFTLVMPGMHEFGFRVALEINMSITTAIKTFCGFTHAQINKSSVREEAHRLPAVQTPLAQEVKDFLDKISDGHQKNSYAFKFFGNAMQMSSDARESDGTVAMKGVPEARRFFA